MASDQRWFHCFASLRVNSGVYISCGLCLSGIEFDTGLFLTVFLYRCFRFSVYRLYFSLGYNSLVEYTRNSCCDTDSKKILDSVKAMCHTDIEAPMVTNWFPYFQPTSLFFGSKRSKLLSFYLLPTMTCFVLSRKTYWFGEIRGTDSLPWELQRRYATLP